MNKKNVLIKINLLKLWSLIGKVKEESERVCAGWSCELIIWFSCFKYSKYFLIISLPVCLMMGFRNELDEKKVVRGDLFAWQS